MKIRLTMFIDAIARHALKNFSGTTQRLELIVVLEDLIKGAQSWFSCNREVTDELNSSRSSFSRMFRGWYDWWGRWLRCRAICYWRRRRGGITWHIQFLGWNVGDEGRWLRWWSISFGFDIAFWLDIDVHCRCCEWIQRSRSEGLFFGYEQINGDRAQLRCKSWALTPALLSRWIYFRHRGGYTDSKENCSIVGAVRLCFGFTANANAVSGCVDNEKDATWLTSRG